jgi:hypothetical protein
MGDPYTFNEASLKLILRGKAVGKRIGQHGKM